MKITITERWWCQLVKPYYSSKKEIVGREGQIVGESRDATKWYVRWTGVKSSSPYPKENIKRIK